MGKTRFNGHRYVEGYPDPTAGRAIDNIERQRKKNHLSLIELEFFDYVRHKLGKRLKKMEIKGGNSNVVRVLWVMAWIKYQDGKEKFVKFKIIAPKTRGEFELRLKDIKRKAGMA